MIPITLEVHFSAIMDRCESPCRSGRVNSAQRSCIAVNPPVVPNALADTSPTSSTHITSEVVHLREAAKQWMMREGSTEVWAGMAFKELAMSMSSHHESYSDHIVRMATNGEWVDASVIRALAARFQIDCIVFQSKQSPAIRWPFHAMINLAMVNDLHFWGVRPIHPPLLTDPDPAEWMRPDRLVISHYQQLPPRPPYEIRLLMAPSYHRLPVHRWGNYLGAICNGEHDSLHLLRRARLV